LVKYLYVNALGCFLVNSERSLGLQPPTLKNMHASMDGKKMVLLLGPKIFVLSDEGEE
jgi:hypothetical protein